MNFDNLIERYSVDFEIIPKSGGEYVGGEYVEELGEPIPCTGAIVSIPRKKIYQSGGYLTEKDLRLFMLAQLPNEAKVRYKGSMYNVEEDTDYSVFAGVISYILKHVEGGRNEQ